MDRAKSTIDTFLGTSTEPAPFTGPPAVVGARVWVGHVTKPDLAVVDADSGAVSHQDVAGATGGATGMAAIDDQLWVTYHGGQAVRVSSGSEGHPTAVRSLASTLSGVAGDAGAIWVASDDDHDVIRIDPTSLDEVARINVGGKASGVAIGPDGSVWVAIR